MTNHSDNAIRSSLTVPSSGPLPTQPMQPDSDSRLVDECRTDGGSHPVAGNFRPTQIAADTGTNLADPENGISIASSKDERSEFDSVVATDFVFL